MVWKREKSAHRGPRGLRGLAGPEGPKGEPGAWPAEAYDLLQSQMDDLRREVKRLSERVDQLSEHSNSRR